MGWSSIRLWLLSVHFIIVPFILLIRFRTFDSLLTYAVTIRLSFILVTLIVGVLKSLQSSILPIFIAFLRWKTVFPITFLSGCVTSKSTLLISVLVIRCFGTRLFIWIKRLALFTQLYFRFYWYFVLWTLICSNCWLDLIFLICSLLVYSMNLY